jgi:dipeptidyl aminopeptidase/acylaminoacyl peptidase
MPGGARAPHAERRWSKREGVTETAPSETTTPSDAAAATEPAPAPTPFHDLQQFVALPRVAGLAMAPDGSRLVTTVATLNPKRNDFVSAVWEIDPTGAAPARRLTRSSKGERAPVFTATGDLLFLSARPDPEAEEKDDAPAALWLLPAGAGEARVIGTRPGGIGSVTAATGARALVVTSNTLPGAVSGEDDEERRKARKDADVNAILHSGYPVRFWDQDLGPDEPRLLAGTAPAGEDETVTWTDLTPAPGHALFEAGDAAELTPDGSAVVTAWRVDDPEGATREILVRIDVATGGRTTLADDPDHDYVDPRISPDGETVAAIRFLRTKPDRPPRVAAVVVPVAGGAITEVAPAWDRWPGAMRWTPDGAALIVAADEAGRSPLFRIGVADGSVVRLTGDAAAYTDPWVSPDGAHVYALRNATDAPPAPVRLDAAAADQQPAFLPSPAQAPVVPGTLTEVTATAEDGSGLRGWLVLPGGAETKPAPLLLWIHGGPLSSFNSWTWRWSPWLMAARGYAVLLPDPALSTGYGQAFVDRGWANWGGPPFTDLMAITDAVEARPDIDASRTAAMGGSFGGYMANWVAGHTDRFDAIVTHASLWALDQFGPTTDDAAYWRGEMTPAMEQANSPHRFADVITTPMLVIHGDKDYRVPIGEALRLWWDLVSRRENPEDQPHRFLYFPDENHWILKPQDSVVWYETVFAFLAQHVLGEEFVVPDRLR